MRGTLRKRGNNYYIRYYIDGKQVEKAAGTDKAIAESMLNEVMYKLQTSYVNSSESLLKDYLKMWLEDYVKDEKSDGTYTRYKDIIRLHIIPVLGCKKLNELKVIDIEKFIKELKKKRVGSKENKKPLSPTTIQSIYGVLKTSLNKAVKLQLLNDNPCRFVDTPKRVKQKHNILTLDEYFKIYNSVGSDSYEDYIMRIAMELTLQTGLRRGEMCGLTWKDINFDEKELEVNQALIRTGSTYTISNLKTESSYRVIPLDDSTIDLLKFHKNQQKIDRIKYGSHYSKNKFDGVEYDLIFRWENGKYIIPSCFLQRLKRLCTYCKIDKNIRWHDLRHTNATLLLQENVDMKVIQERLGHSVMQTTSDIYAHVTKKMNQQATSVISNLLQKTNTRE